MPRRSFALGRIGGREQLVPYPSGWLQSPHPADGSMLVDGCSECRYQMQVVQVVLLSCLVVAAGDRSQTGAQMLLIWHPVSGWVIPALDAGPH